MIGVYGPGCGILAARSPPSHRMPARRALTRRATHSAVRAPPPASAAQCPGSSQAGTPVERGEARWWVHRRSDGGGRGGGRGAPGRRTCCRCGSGSCGSTARRGWRTCGCAEGGKACTQTDGEGRGSPIQGAARAARRAAHQLARHGPAWKRASLPREKDSARVVRFLTAPTTGAAAATKAFKSSELRAGSCTLER